MQTAFEERSDGFWGPPLDPDEQKPYTIDFQYVDSFVTESIASATWAVTNCTVHSSSFSSKAATVVLKAGVLGSTAVATVSIVTTPSAFKFDRSFKISVKAL